ncbi:MAG TPA: S8 family serine peptidase [Actinomycetota bacterium]|nr:S8 family serine peptidase [Actinomycetota bacterium]
MVYAQASPHSLGGVSLFGGQRVTSETAASFASEDHVVLEAARGLQRAGFDVLQVTRLTINIAGPASLYEEVFNASLVAEERPAIKEQGREDTATFVECPDTDLPGLVDTKNSSFANVLEGVAIEEPRYYMQNAFAPTKAYWHLDVPAGVSLGCNADKAHRKGTTGKGVKVAMVDSGHFAHPFFSARGYNVAPTVLGPGTADPAVDADGHGTAESANVFSNAPDASFVMVKMNFTNTIGAFNAAVGLKPRIISCSWGSSKPTGPLSAADNALAAAIASAVASGIVVVVSAGNGHFGFPGQHPDVISAGGAFMKADGSTEASNYSSGFVSNIYPGRVVPDVCGLVGMKPRAAYIMLPLEAGSAIDVGLAGGGAHPNGDETLPKDGWAAISGTSAAAPQIAGVCALILQACGSLKPAGVRSILKSTARDVTTGSCAQGTQAVVGADAATGAGLIDAAKAVALAKFKCLVIKPKGFDAARRREAPSATLAEPPLPDLIPEVGVGAPVAGSEATGHGGGAEPASAEAPSPGSLSADDADEIMELMKDGGIDFEA